MKKIFICIIFLGKILTFSFYNEINNLPIANSCMFSTEQSVIDNRSFNVISNPAMIALNTQVDYLLEYNKLLYYAQTSFDNIGFLIGKNRFGVVINRFSSGQINVRDIDGVDTNQTIEYSLTTLNLATAIELASNKHSGLYGGITGTISWEKINIETKSYNVNIGAIYNYDTGNNVIRIGTVIKGMTSKDAAVYHCGILAKIGSLSFISGYENKFVDRLNEKIKLGLAFNLSLPYLTIKNLSFGVGHLWGRQSYVRQTTFGLSINFDTIILSYSFAIHQYLGTLQSFNIGIEL